MLTRFQTVALILFVPSLLIFGAAFANSASNKNISTEKVAVAFNDICDAQLGTVSEVTIKGVYSFSMKAASGLYIEIEGDNGNLSSHWVGKSGNDFHDDKLASEQTESLLTLAYLNQMDVDICLLEHTYPSVVFGIRLH